MLMPGSEMANQIRTARATLDNELATGADWLSEWQRARRRRARATDPVQLSP